jgi:glutamate formiminotransferase/formiminotetrahydrofolate cyclodeaminase
MRLVECVPNFSEARRPEVVDAIVAAITAVSGVRLLDRSSDLDHNRTVLTLAGPPEAVEEAAFQAIQKAAELIDLNHHTGEHPRMGATDVVPFIPLSGVTMDECVAMAQRLGQRVGDELQIPVYLYEAAATRPERTNLENIRRGQYEGLRAEIASNPDRKPDFGPSALGPAGATVIGARPFLIAFNVYLTSEDVSIAKKIAKAVRNSSGGLRYVKALGLLVEGRAQVSMNLTDFEHTPIARVVELIRREAERYGVAIHHSELIGLIPQAALVEAAVWYTQLDDFSPDLILENRLFAEADSGSETGDRPVDSPTSFLDRLAASTATPGGGAAAAYTAAMGAALVAMVAGLTVGKKKYAAVEAEMQEILSRAESLRADLTAAVTEDSAAFEAVMSALKMPKESPEQLKVRGEALEQAMLQAARVPLRVVNMALEVIELAVKAAQDGNLNAISDAASAAAMARAGLTSAGYNVRINLVDLQGLKPARDMMKELQKLELRAGELEEEIGQTMKARGRLA